MPRRAPHPCAYPGCPRLVQPGERYCAEHQAEAWRRQDRNRGTSSERGYDARWREARDAYIEQHPVCERCRRAKATEVHHIVAKRDGGSDESINLLALCHLCHCQVEAKAGTLFGGHTGAG